MSRFSDLTAKVFHMRINRSVIQVVLVSDNLFHERLSLDDMIVVLDEVREYQEFRFGYFDGFSCKT